MEGGEGLLMGCFMAVQMMERWQDVCSLLAYRSPDIIFQRTELKRKFDWSCTFLLASQTQPVFVSGTGRNHVHIVVLSETSACSEVGLPHE
jgi:hypothetical protein